MVLVTSPTSFDTAFTNVEAKLEQSWDKAISTLFQRCATLKIWRRILFHFQRRINVILTLIHNVETTLIRRWNVGWESKPNFLKNEHFLAPDTHTYVCALGSKKCSFFGKLGLLCFLVTSVLRNLYSRIFYAVTFCFRTPSWLLK